MESVKTNRLLVSLSRSMKAQVAELAKADGVSMSHWINTAIAYRIGRETPAEAYFSELKAHSDPNAVRRMLLEPLVEEIAEVAELEDADDVVGNLSGKRR